MRNLCIPVLCLTLAPGIAVPQSQPEKKQASEQLLAAIKTAATCPSVPIACGQTVNGNLTMGGCTLSDGTLVNNFTFKGTIGESVGATLSSSAFTPVLELANPEGDVTNSSNAQAPGEIQINTALNMAGTWTWMVTNTASSESGAYTFNFTCGSTPPKCIPNNSTLICLQNSRFQVTATFNAGASGSGNAQAVQLTTDTGYLWFFESTNVEVVLKVLDGCGLNGHYWVFAGGLTNVNVAITVTDTQTGMQKTYTNPANTTFQPIQDTSAFSTCP
jgi:hypothetical protein